MGFFEWVREGVRQAVVLGFADAVEDVGARNRDEDFGTALAQSLRDRLTVVRDVKERTVIESAVAAGTPPSPAAGRRRLGRSLEGLRKAA